jgi:AraC-like DNA-binding protein
MKALPLTEAGMFGPFVNFIEAGGGSVNRVLDRSNVSREMVDLAQGKVTKLQFYQFLNTSGRNLGVSDLGYQVGEHFGMRFIGPVGASVLRAATLKDAIGTFAAHLESWIDDNHLWLEPDGDHVWLCNIANDGLQEFQQMSDQCAIMAMISLIREAAGPQWSPEHLRLPPHIARAHLAIPSLAETSITQIESGIAVRFPARFLALPVHQEPPTAEAAELAPGSQASFGAALEQTLYDQFPFIGIPTIPQTAEITGTSVRTLQRHLMSDGMTYQRLIERIRFRKARERLQQDDGLTITELSSELHYASPSSFVRAFRRIAGCTPDQYKRGLSST